MDSLVLSGWGFSLWMGLLGLISGSFMNVVIYRLPIMLDTKETSSGDINLWLPNSFCPECHHSLRWFDNIPLLSWLLLRGRCRYCNATISWRYPVIEFVCALGFAMLAILFPSPTTALSLAIFFWFVLALSAIDLKVLLLPDLLTLPLLWLGLIYNSLYGTIPLEDGVYGVVAGYLALWIIYWGFRLTTGREGMGYGDFKMLAAIGAWCGWQALPPVVLIAAFVGIFISLIRILMHKAADKTLPFGPCLACAGMIVLGWLNLT